MGAWTAEERLTLIDMLGDELHLERYNPTLRELIEYQEKVQYLAGETNGFLEAHKEKYATVIERYNTEKPEEEAAL